jgi:hypothetical protein
VVTADRPAVLGGLPPAALAAEPTGPGPGTVFCAEGDWRRAEAEVTQAGPTVHVVLAGDGDLDAAAVQACRFLALDVDGRGWPQVGRRDPVMVGAQARAARAAAVRFPFPYEAAAWSVLAQRLRIVQAARLHAELIARHGQDVAFPPPSTRPSSTWIFRAVRVSTCEPSPRQLSMGCWTGQRCALSTPTRRSSACSRSRGSARSRPSWSWSAARTPPTRCPATNAGWTPRSPSSTAPLHPGRSLRGVAALPHLSRRPPACAARAAHRRDRRPLSHPDRRTRSVTMPLNH